MRILYIEDDVDSFIVFYTMLHSIAEIQWLPHSIYATELVKLIKYDLVILDMFGTFSEDIRVATQKLSKENLLLTSAAALETNLGLPFVGKLELTEYVKKFIHGKGKNGTHDKATRLV